MKINQKYVSFYYQGMAEVPDMQLERSKTALLIIDMQKEFVNRDCGDYLRQRKRETRRGGFLTMTAWIRW